MVIAYDIQFLALTVRLPQLIVTGQSAAVKPTTTHVIVFRLVGFVEEHVTPTLGPDAPRGRDVVHRPLRKRSTPVIVVRCSMCLSVHSLETGLHTNNLSRSRYQIVTSVMIPHVGARGTVGARSKHRLIEGASTLFCSESLSLRQHLYVETRIFPLVEP